ncbi:PREDICTED: uncharacterized protein LOC104803105 [Tarenaya hassleriana]|uniref:uncharacterized protein LOC104803105 n=1 Tax=Tarenaya hassleriana TaxID=28532 RepID=UPI00053C7F11|nr:PREDICTED: uncharacterized protein LOC104803105 [Tarenaya hassleriana]
MGVDKEGSRSGGYVGGFFQLFDWKGKSRKKLFTGKSDYPEHSKQGKIHEGSLPMTQLSLVDEEEAGVGARVKVGSDYSCSSSVTDDDGYGARAPGVVARLMGLDSLPMSEQPFSSPFSDTRSLQESHLWKKNNGVYHEHDYMYSGYLLHKVEGPARKFPEPKPQRTPSKPIEKFQTEILPPRSAKSIPITHHKLLSPIKSPAFIPSKNAAHIMEAAARIIEPSPQVMPPRAKMTHLGSSSVQLKLRDLREKVESSQKMGPGGSSSVSLRGRDMKEKVEDATSKPSRLTESTRRQGESDAVRSLKGQSLNKSWNGPLETTSQKASNSEDGCGVKTKGRSISLAVQAKVNVQRREGLTSTSSTAQITDDRKEWMASNSTQLFRSQPGTPKNGNKKSSNGVLRQNNQKQNCVSGKDRASSKSSVSSLQGRKHLSSEPSSSGRTKTSSRTAGNSKTGSRKFGVDATDSEKGNSHSDTKNYPRKKRLIDGGFRYERNHQAKLQAR